MEHLIPDHWFVDRHWTILLLTTVISIIILGKGADWLVESASGTAYRFGIPKIIVGHDRFARNNRPRVCGFRHGRIRRSFWFSVG